MYILDIHNMEYNWINHNIEELLGAPKNEINASFISDSVHPQDQPILSAIENKINKLSETNGIEWLSRYNIIFDFRVKNSSGHYVRILNQVLLIKDTKNNIHKRFGIYTDISHIKKNGEPSLSLISISGHGSMIDIPLDIDYLNDCPFTKREKEIASLIIQGLSNKEIASKLFISIETVKNHKKHIFSKSNCCSSLQLAQVCSTSGWTPHLTLPHSK